MADKRDYYEVLGLSKSSSDDEIKKAYRKMAKENHPDLHPNDKACEARFKEVNEAYEVLSDPDKRSKYDQFGHAAFDPSSFASSASGFGGFGGFGDIFSDIFGGFGDVFTGGGGGSRTGPSRGENIRTGLTVDFKEAAFGCSKEVTISRVEDCETCSGSGAAEGTTPEICPQCNGSGSVRSQQRTALGVFSTTSPCQNCSGTGKIIHQPCNSCRGTGISRKHKKITVNVPAGIDDGQTISLRGQGNAGKNGGPSGDLLITVGVRPDPLFERDGTSVLYSMNVTVPQAALGAEMQVPTLDGKVKYTLPAGTQSGTVFRLRGKGIPSLRGTGRGDQFITVEVEIPSNLNSHQKELFKQLAESLGDTAAGTGETKPFKKNKKKKK